MSSPPTPPPSCVLLLNGFPGVGKLSIAKALEASLINSIPYRLIDNHLLIDAAVAIEPNRNTAHYALRKSLRETACRALKALNEQDLIIIFTTALSTSHLPTPYDDIAQLVEYTDLAESRGVPLVFVNILCDFGVNSGRLGSKERKEVGGKTKLVDISVLEKIRQETSLLDRQHALGCGKKGSVFYFELDTSDLAIEQVTQRVWQFLYETEAAQRQT